MRMRISPRWSIVLAAGIVGSIGITGCGGGSAGGGGASDGEAETDGSTSTEEVTGSETDTDTKTDTKTNTSTDTETDACPGLDLSDAPPPPGANIQTGSLALSLPDDVDPATLEGFVVGQPDKELFVASDCKFYIAGVEPGEADVVLMSGSLALPSLTGPSIEGKNRGVRFPVTFVANQVLDGGKPTVPLAGRMKGKVVKSDGANALGTAVFIPGIQFASLFSAANGGYDFTFLPVGTHQFAFTADGYNDGFLTVEIESDTEYAAPDVVLVVNTVDVNEVVLNNGDSTAPSYTVNVLLATDSDAITMRVGETDALTGVSSEPVKNFFQHTCEDTYMGGPGNANVVCKVCVAVENEDGSEVSNCDTIFIDLFAVDGNLFTPDFTVPAFVTASDGEIPVTDITQNDVATGMSFKHGQMLTWLPEGLDTSTTLPLSANPLNCKPSTYEVSLKLMGADGIESTSVTKNLGVKCWDPLPTSAESPARYNHETYFTGATGDVASENRVVVFGGQVNGGTSVGTGAIYNLANKTWTAISTTNAPSTSSLNLRVAMAGTKLFAWSAVDETGAVLDVATNTWTAIDTDDADSPKTINNPASHYGYEAVAAGNKVMIWGGIGNGVPVKLGYVFDVGGAHLANWTQTDSAGLAVPEGRTDHVMVYTGDTGTAATEDRVIVYGGQKGGTEPDRLNTGGVYKVSGTGADTWTAMAASPLAGANRPCAVWTGSTGNNATAYKMIVFGGDRWSGGYQGAMYDLETNTWGSLIADGNFGASSSQVACTWTGKYLFVVTRDDATGSTKGGGLYNPATNSWTRIGTEADLVLSTNPFTRQNASAVALGDGSVFYWGGRDTIGGITNQNGGYIYYPWETP